MSMNSTVSSECESVAMLKSALAVCLASVCAAAQDDLSVRVVLDPPVVPFHRQASFTIEVEYSGDKRPELPSMADRFGGLSVYGMPQYQMVPTGGGRLRIRETYILDPVYPGVYPIEPVTIKVGEDREITVASPMLRVRELTLAETEEAMIFDGTLPQPQGGGAESLWTRWQFWTGIATIALALFAAWMLTRRPEIEAPGAVSSRSPWEIALERLRVLEQRNLPQSGRFGTYYVDLSYILRYYIEARFHLHAPERTTPEFLEEASELGVFTDDLENLVETFLRHCDLVKFAQHKPSVEDMSGSFGQVTHFVKETVPQPAPETEEVAV